MGKETRLFKSQEPKNRADVSEFLRQLADRVSNGQVVLSQGQQEITLQLPPNLNLEIQRMKRREPRECSTAWKLPSNGLTESKAGRLSYDNWTAAARA